jgi:general secretion pathway protein G
MLYRIKNRGFTLLELLLVLAIISFLATVLAVGLLPAKGKAKEQATRALIYNIRSSLEAYYAVYGDYPPTDLSDLYMGTSNGVNNGIESVVACLSDQNKGGPFLLEIKEDKYTNLDGDSTATPPTNWWFGDTQLREIVDEFRNPIVYFHSRDYDNPGKGSEYSFRKIGEAISPQMSPKTSVYFSPFSFQLWSIGIDEQNNNGLNNDINSWN